MNYERPNMQIFMIEEDDIIRTSGDVDLGGIQIGPGVVPGQGEDGSGYQ